MMISDHNPYTTSSCIGHKIRIKINFYNIVERCLPSRTGGGEASSHVIIQRYAVHRIEFNNKLVAMLLSKGQISKF